MKIPPPNSYKQEVVASHKDDYSVLIETGTYYGDMCRAQMDNFDTIYSIELGEYLYFQVQRIFMDYRHVKLYQGDSPTVLQQIIPTLTEPVLFWLDAHWSGGKTVLGDKPCPLLEELDVILASPFKHGILIDDARCFGVLNKFPTMEETGDKLGEFTVKNDIIWRI